jgi:hypothetical protein
MVMLRLKAGIAAEHKAHRTPASRPANGWQTHPRMRRRTRHAPRLNRSSRYVIAAFTQAPEKARSFMGFIRQRPDGISQIYTAQRRMRCMKMPTARITALTRAKRGFGQIILALLFLLSVFQLSHLPAMPANHDTVDLWRGLLIGTLFLFFCLPGSGRPHSGP